MTTNAKADAEKAKNYSADQEKILKANAPFDLAKAKEFGVKMGKSYQSIIAKCKSLDIEYITKPVPRKKATQATKSDLVEQIQAKLDRKLDGLEKSTRGALLMLINGLDHALPEKVEADLPELGDSDKA